ncbi:MAG TPA: hypothetical protein VNQ79_01055 [Blastocatellia bacterium]|nr:hypothetical protein [Blastocatellia bacterium]
MTALFALMNGAPRIQVPNDFDFRLRARLAQAKAAQAAPRGGLGFFTDFWKLSFSWGQAASAMAAVALVVTLSTVWLVRNNNSTSGQPSDNNIAAMRTVPSDPTPAVVTAPPADRVSPAPAAPGKTRYAVRNSGLQLASTHRKELKASESPDLWPPKQVVNDEVATTHQILVRSSRGVQRVAVHEVSFGGQPAVVAVDTTPRPVQAVF